MKTFFKILAGLVAVIVLAVVALLIFIDPNDYKQEIQNAARDKADIDLKIGGDMGLSIFPTFALELPEVEATSLKPNDSPLQSAKLKQASVSVSILALLSGELKMNGLLLDGLDLRLQSPSETTADSTGKAQAPSTSTSTTDATPSDTSSSGAATASNDNPKALKLNLGDVSIRDARIEYTDRKTDQRLVLSNFNFSGEDVNSAEPFNLNSGFTLDVFQKQQTSADLSLKGELKTELFLDTLNQLFKANDLDFKLDLQTAALGSKPVPLKLTGDIAADLANDQASIDKLVLEVAGLKLNADINVAQMRSAPKLSGQLEIEPFALNPLLKTLNQTEVKTTDDKVLQAIGLKAKLTGPANVIELSDLELRLDDTRFTGLISHNLNTGAQIVKLQGDRIDADRYLPPAADKPAATGESQPTADKAAGEGRYSKAPLLPIDTLKGLNIDSTLGLTELKVSGLTVTKLKLLTNAKDGLIKVPQVSGDFYQGTFSSNAVIDARKAPVTINIEKNINGIKLGGLLQDLMDKKMFSGTFNMNGKYQTEGNSIYDIVHSVDGNMKMNLQDGRLEGVNLTDKLCSGILQLQGKTPNDSAVDYTEFSNLNGSVNILNGVADNRDLKASMVGVGLTGAGKVNLPQENFDYGLSLTILQELKGPNCSIDNKLHNLALPLRCAGGFNDDPAKMCGIDKDGMKKVFADMGGKELQEKADKEKARLKEKAKAEEERIKDKLKGMFGG